MPCGALLRADLSAGSLGRSPRSVQAAAGAPGSGEPPIWRASWGMIWDSYCEVVSCLINIHTSQLTRRCHSPVSEYPGRAGHKFASSMREGCGGQGQRRLKGRRGRWQVHAATCVPVCSMWHWQRAQAQGGMTHAAACRHGAQITARRQRNLQLNRVISLDNQAVLPVA